MSRLSDLALRQGDFIRAEGVASEALALAEAVGEQAGIGVARANLALSMIEQQRSEQARKHAAESVIHFTQIGEQEGTSTALELLAAALDDAEPQEAARLLGLAAGLREAVGSVRGPPEQSLLERTLESARRCLGQSEFAVVFDSARRVEPDAAMTEAALKARALG